MHLPDGFLDTRTALLSTGVAVAGVSIALRQVRLTMQPRRVPMLGLAAAFVFAAQMLNFPVAGGTSGHLVGGVLTAVLLGPSAAVIVLACVLIVQCLMFADGGLFALGANMFNMGVVSVCAGYAAFDVAKRMTRSEAMWATVFAAGFGGWFGTVAASITCAGMLALSGMAPWGLAFPAMANIHMVIGIGEGLITGLVTYAVLRSRPELVGGAQGFRAHRWFAFAGYSLLISIGLAMFVAPFASPWPDGLEYVAHKLGFESRAGEAVLASPLPDYQLPGIGSAAAATAVAGLIGTVVVFCAAWGLAKWLVPVIGASKKNASTGN